MGGEGFTPEQIAEAEADFERRLGISLTGVFRHVHCGCMCRVVAASVHHLCILPPCCDCLLKSAALSCFVSCCSAQGQRG